MERVPVKKKLVQLVNEFGGSVPKAARKMGIPKKNLYDLLNVANRDVNFGTIKKIAAHLGLPAPLVFYRESDGGLIDLNLENLIEKGPPDDYLGRAFSECRRAIGLSQVELATRSQVAQGNMSRYERGIVNPLSLAIDRISAVLGIIPDYLPEVIYKVIPNYQLSITFPEVPRIVPS